MLTANSLRVSTWHLACCGFLEDISGYQVLADKRAQQVDDTVQASVARVMTEQLPTAAGMLSVKMRDLEKGVSDVVRQPAKASMP